ncbi:Ser/Thr protein phosphatase [Histomonas meleagridis]|uniref:Ser/Thr protein phosphatase n=1 Tax=Histomonas meleagridis TaxID=135588 RepID=UPI003559DB4D|nr:Ser/Thr protein phosphatase [Histomonas meleagridis]KAH0796810.1 Ser/Thr protein phosphatase [Histomonas meleagridis]
MNVSFGQIFACELVNTKVIPFKLPLIPNKPERILILSDTHIGAYIAPEKSIPLFLRELQNVINIEQPTIICHLGDIVNGSFPNGATILQDVLTKMNDFKIPIYAIGGNHDRDYFASLIPRWKNPQFIHPLKENAILLTTPAGPTHPNPTNMYLAHDLLNNYRVRDQFALSFLTWIKNGCKINSADWLITGHTHTSLLSFATRTACVGQFSPEINVFGYTIIGINGENVSIETKYMPGKQAPKQ